MVIPQIFLTLKAKFGDNSSKKLNQIPEIVETYQWVLTSIKADTGLYRTGTSKCLCLVEIYLIKAWKIFLKNSILYGGLASMLQKHPSGSVL